MTGGDSSPTVALPPPKRQHEPSTTTTTTLSLRERLPPTSPIHKLDDDLLLEVFLRLPSLATLVRAAFTCRAWRCAVASSPDFRRRFRALHTAPLLGFFFGAPGSVQASNAPGLPTFVPIGSRDRDLSAAVRGGDFFLASIYDVPVKAPIWKIVKARTWEIVDCCHGCVLLMNWDFSSLVVFNPLTQRGEEACVFDMGCEDMFDGHRGNCSQAIPRLLISAEDPASFRVVLLAYDRAHDECRIRAVVFSSDTWGWSVHPWVDVPASSGGDKWIQDASGMQANGHLYWVYENQRYLISLDTAMMQFCISELPDCLKYRSFDVGETKDGATCIVFSDQLDVGVMMSTRGNDGVERWVLDMVVLMDKEIERGLRVGLDDRSVVVVPSDLYVFAVRDGFAYLATSVNDLQTPCCLLSLCLETMTLEKLLKKIFEDAVHPYIMAWPHSLVGNYGRFAIERCS